MLVLRRAKRAECLFLDGLEEHRLRLKREFAALRKTFAAEIRAKFLRGDYGPAHVGNMPADTTGTDSRAYLERELKKAIRQQKYEKAAEIQRCLDALESEAPGADGKEQK